MAKQSQQNFRDYAQFLPFASGGNLSVKKQGKEEKARTGKENTIVFRDLDRNSLWIASTENPYFVWGINSSQYNFVKNMYSDKNIRILGKSEPSFTDEEIVFFQLVDEDNKILAVLKPLFTKQSTEKVNTDIFGQPIINYTKEELESEIDRLEDLLVTNPVDSNSLEGLLEKLEEDLKEGRYVSEDEKELLAQQQITYSYKWETLQSSKNPAPIWDFEELYSEIQTMAPEMTTEGIELGTAVGLNESISDTNTPIAPETEEELIIDLDTEE